MTFIDTFERLLAGESGMEPLDAPWLGWCLVSLCRQRARQTWLVLIRDQRLGDVEEDSGDVPGIQGWTYSFHGRGLCLSGPGNENLDVDFHGDNGESIDPYFFATRVLALEPQPLPEARLARFLPTEDLIVQALHELRQAGLLWHPQSKHAFQLHPRLEALHARIAELRFDDDAAARRWARVLGDGGLAEGIRPGEGAHRDWLLSVVRDPNRASGSIEGIAHLLPPHDVVAVCEELLEGEIGAATGTALELLERDGLEASGAVERFLHRLEPGVHHPYSAVGACRYLLRRGVARERAVATLLAFAAVRQVEGYIGNPMISELATLALEHAPEHALPLVRRALRDSPANVEEMAMLLAALDQTWCHRELERAARDGALEPAQRRRLAHALTLSRSEIARRRGRALMPPRPERESGQFGFTFDEVDANTFAREPFELDTVQALAERLREMLPDGFGAEHLNPDA